MPGTALGIRDTEMNQTLSLSSKIFQVNGRRHRGYERSLFRVHQRSKEGCVGSSGRGGQSERLHRGVEGGLESSKMSRCSPDRSDKEGNCLHKEQHVQRPRYMQ